MNNQMEIELNTVENGPNRSTLQVIETCFNVTNHILACIATVYMSVMSYRAGGTAVTWHAWLCTIGVSDFGSFFDELLKKHNKSNHLNTNIVPIVDDTSDFGILFGKCLVKIMHQTNEKNHSLGAASCRFLYRHSWNCHRIHWQRTDRKGNEKTKTTLFKHSLHNWIDRSHFYVDWHVQWHFDTLVNQT